PPTISCFLSGETGIERRLLEWLRGAAELARDTGVAAEAFYGWARHSLPAEWAQLLDAREPETRMAVLKAVLDKLQAAPLEQLRGALLSAIDDPNRIIPAALRDGIDAIIRSLKRYGAELRQAIGQLRDEATGEPLANYTVRVFDMDTGAEPEELGVE